MKYLCLVYGEEEKIATMDDHECLAYDAGLRASGPGHPDSPPDWWIYRGTGRPLADVRLADRLPDPPPWRQFRGATLPELLRT